VVLITLIDALKCLLRSHIIEAEKVKKIGKGRRGFLNNRRISLVFGNYKKNYFLGKMSHMEKLFMRDFMTLSLKINIIINDAK
jgi:hypothetical protein